MNSILKTALMAGALTLSGMAMAQGDPATAPAAKVPLCSKTVKDECMNPSQAPHRMTRHPAKRHVASRPAKRHMASHPAKRHVASRPAKQHLASAKPTATARK